MKIFHLADLHLGKRYCEFSLIDDQKYILEKIVAAVREEEPQCVIIAGDVYDKAVPSAEAVELFDWFLNELTGCGAQVIIISGNHDSAERIAFGAKLMSVGGVHISPVYSGEVKPVVLSDVCGKVNFYLLPFIKPATVRRFFPDETIADYNGAVFAAVKAMNINTAERNVLVAHQFVTGSKQSGSEEFSVGDVGNVDRSAFDGFDYVALGHIHCAQNVGSERVRYCGTPLKYSLSEAKDEKSVTVAEIGKKGELRVRTLPLTPLREVAEIRGTYDEVTEKSFYSGRKFKEGYVQVVLTDEDEVSDAFAKLRIIYPYLTGVKYDNARTRASHELEIDESAPERSPIELFSAFYEQQNNAPMTDEQRELVLSLIEEIWGDGR